jgi:hypothetical protein
MVGTAVNESLPVDVSVKIREVVKDPAPRSDVQTAASPPIAHGERLSQKFSKKVHFKVNNS